MLTCLQKRPSQLSGGKNYHIGSLKKLSNHHHDDRVTERMVQCSKNDKRRQKQSLAALEKHINQQYRGRI